MKKHLLKTLMMRIETTYATDPGSLTSADVVLAENVEIDPLRMQTDDYMPVSNRFGQLEKIPGAVWSTVQFDVVAGGGGTPIGALGGTPNHDAVLRASAMARTIDPGVKITYSPIDTGEESVFVSYHIDNALFRVMGLRGDLEWIFDEGKAPRMRFTGIGLRVPMVDDSPSAYSLPVKPRPVAMTKVNTQFRIEDAYNLRCSQMSLKLGNKVEYINRSEQEMVILADRASSGSITFELPSLATRNFLGASGICTLATPVTLLVRFGTAVGNTVSWSSTAVQLLNPRLSGNKGTTMVTCDLHIPKNDILVTYA